MRSNLNSEEKEPPQIQQEISSDTLEYKYTTTYIQSFEIFIY